MLPTLGRTDQVTALLLVPATVAVNCCVCPPIIDAVVGATATEIDEDAGESVSLAVPLTVGSAALVAVIVTGVLAVIVAGAVYPPAAETLPVPFGVTIHVTPIFHVPETVALSCCCSDGPSVAVAGVTETVTMGVSVRAAGPVDPAATLVAGMVTVLGV